MLLAATQHLALPHQEQHLQTSRQQHRLTGLMQLSMRCRAAALQQRSQRSSTCSTAAGGGVLWRVCIVLTGLEHEQLSLLALAAVQSCLHGWDAERSAAAVPVYTSRCGLGTGQVMHDTDQVPRQAVYGDWAVANC